MKRLFFVSCMMLMVTNIMAYQSVLVEGRTWSTLWYGGATGIDSIDNRPPTTKLYKVEGDSIINEMTYKKIFSSNEQNKQWNLFRLMREDAENAKVWIWNGYSNKENLEMDFSLNVGDIFNGRCTGIGQTTDRDGNILKVLEFEGSYFLVEGYGWTRMPLDGAGFSLISVSDETGVLIDFSKKIDAYHPMVVENYSWNVVNLNARPGNAQDIVYQTYSEKIEGDTVINDVTYKKLWRSTDAELANYESIGLVREDVENQKVWAYVGDKEYLIYDFACKVGDTITTLKSLQSAKFEIEEIELTIKAIEEIEDLNGVKYNKYTATLKNEFKIVYYERFGSENGWYSRCYDEITGGGVNFMICVFDADGNLVFKPKSGDEKIDNIENCYINETINTKISNIDDEQQNIYYNSQEKTLNVNFEGDEKITIYDTMGKVVMSTTINADTKSISLNLNAGIYIVTNKNQNIYSKFVVK